MDRPGLWALLPRSIALFIILYQFRLIAGELADTSVFIAILLAAFIFGLFPPQKIKKNRSHLLFLAFIIVFPGIIRLIIALPRAFVPDNTGKSAVFWDSALLLVDRNYFSVLFPYYWASLTSFFAGRSRNFLHAEMMAAYAILIPLFALADMRNIAAYALPITMIALFALVVFLQLLSLILSPPPEYKARKGEKAAAALAALVLVIGGGLLFLKPSEENAAAQGGGLLQPKMFRFDFSQVLKLESEISMNNDLVFIVKIDEPSNAADTEGDMDITNGVSRLLRRYVMSGYKKDTGFFRTERDEAAQNASLPQGRSEIPVEAARGESIVNQEYFIVNFDSSAFIGVKQPYLVTPFERWDAASFNSAYAVESMANSADNVEFADFMARYGEITAESLGLSAEDFAFYTDYGADERLRVFSEELVSRVHDQISQDALWDAAPTDSPSADMYMRGARYFEKVAIVYEFLKNGDYRYSLKPGVAADGNQLDFFLYEGKKGYCSYFAFAFTLMLRSLGIPARPAAGFFTDPESAAFGYHPVRSDMAHAWVEVRFPEYGWVEFDPTTDQLAADEEVGFSSGVDPDLFNRLMREILENHSKLSPKIAPEEEESPENTENFAARAFRAVNRYRILLLFVALVFLFLLIRTGFLAAMFFTCDARRKAAFLWRHTLRRMNLAGYRKTLGDTDADFAANFARNMEMQLADVYGLYLASAQARFAPAFTQEDYENMKKHYRSFDANYKKSVSPVRRITAWILPPLALILKH